MKDEREALDALLAENDFLRELAEADMRESMEKWRQSQTQPINYLTDQTRIPDEHSEIGLAHRFVKLKRNAIQYVSSRGWMVWDGKVWNADAIEYAGRVCIQYLDEMLSEVFSRAVQNPDDKAAAETLKWAQRCRTARTLRAILEIVRSLRWYGLKLLPANEGIFSPFN